MRRVTIKLAGESGTGLVSTGEIISMALKRMGYFIATDRDYPSVIKGGQSNFQINFSDEPIYSVSQNFQIGIAFDKTGIDECLETLNKGGTLIHGYERHSRIPNFQNIAKDKEINLVYLPARTLALEQGGSEIMTNMILIGLLWKVLGFDLTEIKEEVSKVFAKKPKLLEIDLRCVNSGHEEGGKLELPTLDVIQPGNNENTVLIEGNVALSLGAIHCGVRNYYAYPMSPASSLLTYISKIQTKTKMVVKQAEDEITAVQMALGSMFAGSRAFVATSGGGFDLMVETISLAGMIETPLVVGLLQRPGPATGLPTWTGQGDLNMAIHSGHGEFARIVMSGSDTQSCFEEIQNAFNLAEKYQIVVIFLSEKFIAESKETVPLFKQKKIQIERGLVTDEEELANLKPENRFEITENGLSKRWLPGTSKAVYFANGDEHQEDGTLDESEKVVEMYAKRMRKQDTVTDILPEPEVFGQPDQADISFVGWGGTKKVMLDVLRELEGQGIKANYLHYTYLWPLKTDRVNQFFAENPNVHIIEGNYNSQLGTLIEDKTKNKFQGKLLKWNGRSFKPEEIIKYTQNNLNK
jgi:2-oxoglutarate/2-oxoacid ferredoxin oxidoreductase subunit alpha